MIGAILAAAVAMTPARAADAAHKQDPAGFCAGVWATLILSRPTDAEQADEAEVYFPPSLYNLGTETEDAVKISCPRPGWYAKQKRTIDVVGATFTQNPETTFFSPVEAVGR